MELESLKRQLAYLEEAEIKINKLVTDRHSQVAAFMAQEKPAIKHAYDVWHLAKGNVSVKCKPAPPLANIEIQKKNAKILSDAKITTTVFKFFLLSLYAGEKKRLQKIVKTKKFRALKPWIGV